MSEIDKYYCAANSYFHVCRCEQRKPGDKISNPDYRSVKSMHEFSALNILTGLLVHFEDYEGLVCLVVNIATQSKLADFNIKMMNELYEIYSPYGLRILGFPCNQFNNEEPGDFESIQKYAEKNNIEWDIFDKTLVNGDEACELYKYLKKESPDPKGQSLIKASFTKFIVSRTGIPVHRFPSMVPYKELEKELIFHLNLDEPIIPPSRPRKQRCYCDGKKDKCECDT